MSASAPARPVASRTPVSVAVLVSAVLATTVVAATLLVVPELLVSQVGSLSGRVAMLLEPVVRGAVQLAACGTVGTLVLAIGSAGGRGPLRRSGRALVRSTSYWALLWSLASVALTGVRLVSVDGFFVPGLHSDIGLDAVSLSARSALVMAWATAVVAVLARHVASRADATGVLVLAAAALAPGALTGHAVHADQPVVAVGALIVHLGAMTAWVGGLLVLVVHARSGLVEEPGLLRWYSRLALACYLTVAASGVANTFAITGWSQLVDGGTYPALLALKIALFLLLGALGLRHRRRTLPAAEAGDTSAFRALAAGEVLVLVVAVGLGVVLSSAT